VSEANKRTKKELLCGSFLNRAKNFDYANRS
jgi:hypothetical protein